jgi:hypothetical protein
VTSADLLIRQVRSHRADKTLALMTADALQEDYGLTQWAALREVAKERRAPRLSEEVSDATRAINPHTVHSHLMRRAIFLACGLAPADDFTILITTGSRPPKGYVNYGSTPTRLWGRRVILVGARWVLHRLALLVEMIGRYGSEWARRYHSAHTLVLYDHFKPAKREQFILNNR